MEKIRRLINLTACLVEKKRPLTWDDLKDTVYKECLDRGTSEKALKRMFERDKEELRDMGIKVTKVVNECSEECYTIRHEDYYLPDLDLNAEEKAALSMVSRLFLGSGTPFSGPAHTVLLKLAFAEQSGAGELEERLSHIHWVSVPRERSALSNVLDALERRKFIEFSYRALNAEEPVERTVEPYGLFSRDGSWYLVGKCHLRDEIRCFKLERICSEVAVNTSNPRTADFEVPTGFSVEKFANWEWPPAREEEDVIARVRFSPRLAFVHDTGRYRVLDTAVMEEGGLEVTYEVADPEQFVLWALGFGEDAEVVYPGELRDLARERLEQVISQVEGE